MLKKVKDMSFEERGFWLNFNDQVIYIIVIFFLSFIVTGSWIIRILLIIYYLYGSYRKNEVIEYYKNL